MKAADIREMAKLNQELIQTAQRSQSQPIIALSGISLFLGEIAAHLAEINERLAKTANPLITVQKPQWVWFKYNTFKYVVDAREVASVSSPDPNHCVIIMRNEGGPDPGRWCEGSYEEVCSKLGIPTEEGR